MIQTGFESRVKVQQIVDNQLPNFILDESPNTVEFLKQYYISQEYQSGPIDIAENLDQYLKLDNLIPEVIVDSSYLTSEISSTDDIIYVSSTKGFPQSYGLLKIDDEIITYTGSTVDSFTGCIRGFSGITSYHANLNQEELVFSESTSEAHVNASFIQNLSSLFLKEFYKKLKYTFTPGLEDVDFIPDLNVGNFIKEARSFYQSKGTDESFRILFNVLYGVTPRVVNLEEFLIKPSAAEFVRREVAIVERISGDPSKLVGQTIKKSSDNITSASISEVEPFTRNNKQYFKISLFVGYGDISAVEGNFTITPSTRSIEHCPIGSSVVTVDSTIGFPENGTIISGNNLITYESKSINQFFGCIGIEEEINSTDDIRSDEIYYGYEDSDITKRVELRLTGVLSKFIQVSDTLSVSEGDIISVKNLGDLIKNPEKDKSYKEIFSNSWIYNTSSRYQIEDISNFKLSSPIDRSSLKVGDRVEIVERNTNNVISSSTNIAYISDILSLENRVTLNNLDFASVPGAEYDLRKKINRASSSIVPIQFGNNIITSDIQNLYTDENYAYIASNSLPSDDIGLSIPYAYQISKDIKTSFISDTVGTLSDDVGDGNYSTIGFSNPAPFIDGDRIYYQPTESPLVGLETGSYYVQIQSTDTRKIKLYSSRSFVGGSNYLTFGPSSGTHKFTLYSQRSGQIGGQKLLKKFPLFESINDGTGQLTIPGSTGMLINGVEIVNYKSDDKIYYGPLKSIDVLNGGMNYDVINPPLITVSSSIGTTALIQPVISGSIVNIDVDSQDYDINSIVSIGISGGNGSGAVLEPILKRKIREILFDGRTNTNSGGISTSTGQLTFLTDHNLINGQPIIYNSNGNFSIGIVGSASSTLINNATYYVKIDNNVSVKLHPSISDYSSGINTIKFSTDNTSGIHKFGTADYKNTISEIKIINGGSEYTNRKLIAKQIGISTINHTINFANHGFNDGDLVEYNYETSSIGISTLSQYYILKIDSDYFKLCDAGIGGTYISNYNRQKYIKFLSTGSGYQYFSYPNISVYINYTSVGFGTTTQEYKTLVATPKVRGNIIDAYLYETGTGYGSTILNLERKPLISIKNGKDAQLNPIIVNGFVDSVNIQYGGLEYYSIPDVLVFDPTGNGSGAELRPIIADGQIIDIKIINSGIGYSNTSSIQVKSTGSNALFNPNIRSLTVDNNYRFGDEILFETNNKLEYSVCGYFSKLASSFGDDGTNISGIIGWAYDGNPIYGPYGYSDPEDIDTDPKLLTSGYVLDITNIIDRPTEFNDGFFVEDYIYTNSGDLDENNGRFAKTEDFPNGVYAYFATLESTTLKPQFPYFIGNKYRSNILGENYNLNQSFDFNNSNLLRNTFPYKVSDTNADNDFIIETNEITRQRSSIESVSIGNIDNFDIVNSGSDYKVNDTLNFNNIDTEGGGLIARVSSIKGKDIIDLNTSIQVYNNAIFTWNSGKEIKVSILPNHNLSNNDYVTISGFSDKLSKLNDFYQIGISSYYSNLIKSMPSSTVGWSTEIYVTQLPTSVSIGSSIEIDSEILSVVEVFKDLNILKVKRGSTGISHTLSTRINFIPDSFTISQNIDYFESKVNDKVYFNPKQSVGVGTVSGITNSITFQFGDSTLTRYVPTQSIHIEDHPFTNNQQVTFTLGGSNNIAISTSSTGNSFNLPQNLYVINKNKNTIGIKTTSSSSEVFFISNGSDSNEYSFESAYSQITGNIKKIKSTVSVSTYHELVSGDIITLNIEPNLSVGIGTSTSVKIKRDSTTGNILINPIAFSSTGINSTTDTITINSHNLNTGDKITYSANLVASGLFVGPYYVYKVNDNQIKLSETYIDCKSIPPTVVDITSTGGSNQNISLINPQIKTVKNNNLVFNLSDTSLSGYNFKIYYDQNFNNQFVSVATTSGFTLDTTGTIGVSNDAALIVNYSSNLPNKLYYNLEKSGTIHISDKDVENYSEILFVDSYYKSDYKISGIGSTTFDISLSRFPEKLNYSQSECDNISYVTDSLYAKGPINKLNIVSSGTGYKKLPVLESLNSLEGKDAYIIAKSSTIGNAKEVRIINEGFEYSSDKTLQPTAYISPLITIKDSNTIDSISVIDGGKGYNNPPVAVIVNATTGKKIDSGILDVKLVGNSISVVNILQDPKGLPEKTSSIFTINNTNGISIQEVQSSSSGIFTCFITTPILGFSPIPFNVGDEVFVEGIQKSSSDGSGFNSEDYGYQFFTVSDYNDSEILDKVVINISNLTNNTGIAKTVQDSFANIIKSTDYPSFQVVQKLSLFTIGEKLISNNLERDLYIVDCDDTFIKVYGSYESSIGEILRGKESGTIATIDSIKTNSGRFKVDYSIRKDLGWANNVGKLDEDDQVISDNDYYQNLSYTVKSPIQYKDLRTVVNNLVHTSGLKNFADTSITSTGISGISSSNATTITRDIIEENRVDTIYDFDLVKDIDTIENSSKYLTLKNKKLTDYTECKTNVVLKIDDIKSKFSNVNGEPSEFLNVVRLDSGVSYDNLLVRVSNIDNSKIQLTELIILNDGVDLFLFEKGSIVNSGIEIVHISGEELGTFKIVKNDNNETYLRFIPIDPYNIDYDLKVLKTTFNSTLPGIGTTSIGFIDLTGSNKTISSGITTSIISVKTDKFTSLHINSQVVNTITNDMNFVELYLSHDGTNTYISEYYFDSEYRTNNYSGNFIGSFSANIPAGSGTLFLNYNNNSSNDISVRSKIVGFGTMAVGVGTYRFKLSGQLNGFERTAIYTSNYSSTVSAASTQLISLDKTNFNSIKSLVKVSTGSTSALHQIMLVQDTNNIYIQQSPFISVGSESGIGTFGGEYSGNNFILKFYPDSSITSNIDILSFNECLYTSLDSINVPPNLEYGTISESVGVDYYNAINGDRINRSEFNLTSDGYPIFAKTFDPSNTSILSKTTGIFNIQNHFFSNGERLIYTPKSTFIGIGSVSVSIGSTLNSVGVVTTILPSDVYVIKLSNDTFKLSTRKDYALLGIGVTFTSNGQGNAHQLQMSKRNEKTIITVDNLIQYPLIYTPISHTLSGNGGQISIGSTIFALSGISTISPKNILKIDNEYMEIVNVGFGTTNIGPITNNGTISLVQVNRGFVGSSTSSHTDSTEARVYKGSYNIVDNNLFFTESPRGNPQILRDSSNLTFETSDFTGRVFLRNDYTSNQIYDDISDQFTGIGRTFTLKVGGANTVGLGSTGGNGILLINSIFQTPTTKNNPENNFSIIENSISGISSVVFSGITSANSLNIFTSEFDINQNQIPRGGIIISLDSSSGLGYAPLVGAEVTATVGSGGSITSVGLGISDNPGSGYNGIVSIGVSVYESGHTGIAASVRASINSGGSLAFTVINGGTGYANPIVFVSRPSYSNLRVNGLSRLGTGTTTSTGVGLLLNVEVGASSTTGIGSTYYEVTKFNISRQGYAFKRGDVFEPVGLITDSRLASPLSEFKLTVLDTFTDSFAAWQFGEFDYIDSVKKYQDGIRTRFPLYYNEELLSFEIQEGSQVNLSNALLIVINGIIQDPGVAYQFDGGTSFVFTTAPKSEDDVSIFFYRGTAGDDSELITDLNETIKRGDTVRVLKNNSIPGTVSQKDRTIFDLSFSDKFETNLYSDNGVDTENYKPLSWTKQKVDRKINGEDVYKTRDSIESLIYPTAKIIKNFSTTDSELFVDNAQFFNYGTPTKFDALLVNEISNANVNNSIETIADISSVGGFSGIITGITTTTGSGGNPLALKFYLNTPTYTGLQIGYPIFIFDTSIGNGVTSIDTSNSSVVGVGTTFLDNVYYIHQFSSSGTVGIITCNIKSDTSVAGLTSFSNTSNPIGKFSWGRLSGFVRSTSPISIAVTANTVDVGLSTFPTIQRRGTGLRNTGALLKVL